MSTLFAAVLLVLAALVQTGTADSFDLATFDSFIATLEKDALELAAEVERLYAQRCDVETMNAFQNSNYGECMVEYPGQQCSDDPNYASPPCKSGDSKCSRQWSFSVS
jgi:hypothetical protein